MVDGALPPQVGTLTGDLFIWRDGVWCPVDVSSQLVYLCGRQLVALGRRALAAGRVRLGPRLPQRPSRRRYRHARPHRSPPPSRRSCGVQTDTEHLRSTRRRDVEMPPTQLKTHPTIPSKREARPTVPSKQGDVETPAQPKQDARPTVPSALQEARHLLRPSPVSSNDQAKTATRDSSVPATVGTRGTNMPTTVTPSDSEGEVFEVEVSQKHVEIYRNFLERTAPDVDLKRFDEDYEYNQRMFFRIQPYVRVARSLAIEALLRAGRTRAPASELCAEHFAAQLGLTPTAKRKRESDSDEGLDVVKRRMRSRGRSDTENKPPPRQTTPPRQAKARSPRRKSPTTHSRGAKSSSRPTRSRQAPPPRKAPPPRPALAPLLVARSRASRPPPPTRGVPYSSLEDQSIVSWLSASERRERGVNGNRVWKELQRHFGKIAGQERSWHSLRNRYLRSVLPALHRLALPLDTARRLRAHAAIGEMKAQKTRRNSIFATRPALSAARPAARVGPGPGSPGSHGSHGSSDGPASPGSSAQTESAPAKPGFDWSESDDDRPLLRPSPPLRSPPRRRNVPEPTKAPDHKKAPRIDTPESYSALTKRFALRPRSSPASTPGSGNATPAAKGTVTPVGTTPADKVDPLDEVQPSASKKSNVVSLGVGSGRSLRTRPSATVAMARLGAARKRKPRRRLRRGPPGHRRRLDTTDSEAESAAPKPRRSRNDMEKDRRQGLKSLFEELKLQIPEMRKRRAPNMVVLREATALCRRLGDEQAQRDRLRQAQDKLMAKLRKLSSKVKV